MIIKKLQQLKAKKGFTLVELLVVIAIIGILAAILIPLMANFLDSARVSNANTTAKSARDMMVNWLADQGRRNRGMVPGQSGWIIINVAVAGIVVHDDNSGAIEPVPPQSGQSFDGVTVTWSSQATTVWNLDGYTQIAATADQADALEYDLVRLFVSQFQSARNCTFIWFIGGANSTCLQAGYLPGVIATGGELAAAVITGAGAPAVPALPGANFVPGRDTMFRQVMDGKFTEPTVGPIVRGQVVGTNEEHA